MPLYTYQQEASGFQALTQAARFEPTFGQVFLTSAAESFRQTTPQLLANGLDLFFGRFDGVPISEELYKRSVFFREGIKFREGMTVEEAEMLADRHDQRVNNEFVLVRSGSPGALLLGGLVGSLPDPVNFIPIFGPAARAAGVARFGKMAGSALISGTEAAVLTAAIQPFVAGQAAAFQEDFTAEMAMQNIAFGFVIGSGFGAITGGLSRIPPAIRARATSKAVRDVIEGRPVDVSGVMEARANITDDIRTELNNSDGTLQAGPQVEPDLSGEGSGFGRFLEPDATPQERARIAVEILRKPGPERTPGEIDFLARLDVPPEVARAVEIASLVPQARTPENAAFLEAFRRGTLIEVNEGVLANLEVELATTREQLAALKADDPQISSLRAQERQLEGEIGHTQGRLEELTGGKELDFTVAEPRAPALPEVEPTTLKNVDQLDLEFDDIAVLNDEIKALDDAKALTAEDRADLELAITEKAEAERMSQAYKDAAACILKGGV